MKYKDWRVGNIGFNEDGQSCELCRHYPIKEICTITNQYTREEKEIGNICVKKFYDINSKILFDAIKRVKVDNYKSVNLDFIDFAFNNNLINKWEFDFYKSIFRKRKLSPKQKEKKLFINKKLLCEVFK